MKHVCCVLLSQIRRIFNKSNTMDYTSGAGTVYRSTWVLLRLLWSWSSNSVAQSRVFAVGCCRRLLVFLSLFSWKLFCLSFKKHYTIKKKKKNAHKFASSQKEISTENNDNIYMDSAKARGILLSDEELKGIIYWL